MQEADGLDPFLADGRTTRHGSPNKNGQMYFYAIYPPTRHLAVKVRLFIDFLVARFSAGPEGKLNTASQAH
ncbi:MAG: DNA-binding transcriptional LysR family regulator [Afipia broomeae]